MTVTSTSNLFTPIKVGNATLQHRVAMAPLTRFRAPGHIPSEALSRYYQQRAARAGTLIVSEGTFIAAKAGGYNGVPGIWNQEQIDGWKNVTSKIHDEGSFLFVQLWALGRVALADVLEKDGATSGVVSASAVLNKGSGTVPRPLTREEIKEYVQIYVQAAKNSIAAGADGVEIHSANGYLLDQFLHENTNQRTDEYGGSIQNRARFILEVVDALTEAVGADKVGIRFSPWSTFEEVETGFNTIPQWSYVIAEIEKRAQQGNRLAYIHMIEHRISGIDDGDNGGSNEFVRHIWQGILIKAGGLTYEAEQAAKEDPKAIIALGRYFISNPDLVDRLEHNIELTPYNRDTFYTTDPYDTVGYTDYKTARVDIAEETARLTI